MDSIEENGWEERGAPEPEELYETTDAHIIRATTLKQLGIWFRHSLREVRMSSPKNRLMEFDCFLFASGFGQLAGLRSAKQIGDMYGMTKMAASKIVNKYVALNEADELPGQRSKAGKKNMTDARNGQLK